MGQHKRHGAAMRTHEMVERAALAICKKTHTGGQCSEPGNCDFCHTAAWAALIDAIKPTAKMLKAGEDAIDYGIDGAPTPDVAKIWAAMVEAALEGEPT